MADNVTDGSGNTFATDDVTGVHYPKEKLVYGADDSVTNVTTSSGLPVQVVASSATVTVDASGTTVPVSNAGLTELAAAINTNRVDVNIAADSVGIGGGTQYTEDAAAAANPVGNATILIRTDTPATQTTTDGDNVAQRGTDYGAAYVQVVTSAGAYVDTFGGGTQYTEDAAAAANPVGNALIVVRDDARGGSLTTTDGDNVALRGTNAGELYVKQTDSVAVTNAGLTELAAAINASSQMDINIAASAVDVALGTDISDVFGTATLITTTQADNLANTTDTLNTSAFLYAFDGTTWDRVTNGGGVEATALRVTIASDSTGVLSVDDNGSSLTIDNAQLSVVGSGTEATAMRVTIATDSTGVLSVDDNGASLTVDNAGLTELAAAINASSQMDVNIAASAVDVMLGTDFSDVFGTASLITTTQADNLANTTDTINVAAFGYVFDGSTWDRALGNSTDGTLVNLGANNDVTITSGTVTTVTTVTTVSTVSSVSAVIAGTGATNLGKAEDGAHTTGDTGVAALFVRSDAPTAARVDGASDYINPVTDSAGAQWVRNKEIPSYAGSYRLADSTNGQLGLLFKFVAEPVTNKQLATIYHTAGSTKTVKIRRVELIVIKGEPGIYAFELRALSSSTAPATGNPAITPRAYDPADSAAEASLLALPTTAGSLVGADTGTVGPTIELDGDALGPPPGRYVLYEYDSIRHVKPLIMRAGSAEGFAVNGRCTVAARLTFTILIEFTEE